MSSKPPLRIFVLIDALGWRLLKDHQFLPEMLPFRRPLRTVLGYSSGAIPAILTGRRPSENGRWNLLYYDPYGSPFRSLRILGLLPERWINNRVARRLVTEAGRRFMGLGPSFECCLNPALLPYFNWAEKRSIYEPGGIEGSASIFDLLKSSGTPYRSYSYHQWSDAEILRLARQDVERGGEQFFFVYLSELDAFLHRYCSRPDRCAERLAWYEGHIGTLFAAALERDPECTLAIFSDHGMTPVTGHFDVAAKVESLGIVMPHDYLAVYDSTMARFWMFSARARNRIIDCLGELDCGRILPKAELRELGILFDDGRYGDLIFLLNPGNLIGRSDFNGPRWMPDGMHGYHPDDPWSDAVYLSNKAPEPGPDTIVDVFKCLAERLGT